MLLAANSNMKAWFERVSNRSLETSACGGCTTSGNLRSVVRTSYRVGPEVIVVKKYHENSVMDIGYVWREMAV